MAESVLTMPSPAPYIGPVVTFNRVGPPSLAGDLLSAVGLTLGSSAIPEGRKRDPQFRKRILTAYEYRCAVCGFDVRLGIVSIALDAAHIFWHQAGGPDRESNGLVPEPPGPPGRRLAPGPPVALLTPFLS
jgi:hypothetical protein